MHIYNFIYIHRYIRFHEKLGSGAYKDVYRAYDTIEGIEVAWNLVTLKGIPKIEKARIINEVRLLEKLNHNNIISFHGSWVNREREEVVFVTEILSSGTLKSFMTKVKVVRWRIIKRWCIQILRGLEYLHRQDPPIIHRDLKCENIFINGTSGDLRIGDLGLSTVIVNRSKALSVLGTPEFMAPELYDEDYNEKVDVYAFGMCLLEMITKDIPYRECSNPAQIFKKVTGDVKPKLLGRVREREALEFMLMCLEKDPSNRPTATTLLKHRFLSSKEDDDQEPIVGPPPSATDETSQAQPTHQHQQQQQQHAETTIAGEADHAVGIPAANAQQQQQQDNNDNNDFDNGKVGGVSMTSSKHSSSGYDSSPAAAAGAAGGVGQGDEIENSTDTLPSLPLHKANSSASVFSTDDEGAVTFGNDREDAAVGSATGPAGVGGVGGFVDDNGLIISKEQQRSRASSRDHGVAPQGQASLSGSVSSIDACAPGSAGQDNSKGNGGEDLGDNRTFAPAPAGKRGSGEYTEILASMQEQELNMKKVKVLMGRDTELMDEERSELGGMKAARSRQSDLDVVTGSADNDRDTLHLSLLIPVEGKHVPIEFDFHLRTDDPHAVAREMVTELNVKEEDVSEISRTINMLALRERRKQAEEYEGTASVGGGGGGGGGPAAAATGNVGLGAGGKPAVRSQKQQQPQPTSPSSMTASASSVGLMLSENEEDEGGDCSDSDEEVDEEVKLLKQEYSKNVQRSEKAFNTRMENLTKSKAHFLAQHQKILEKHSRELAEYEQRVKKAEGEQSLRLKELRDEWEKKKEAAEEKKMKRASQHRALNDDVNKAAAAALQHQAIAAAAQAAVGGIIPRQPPPAQQQQQPVDQQGKSVIMPINELAEMQVSQVNQLSKSSQPMTSASVAPGVQPGQSSVVPGGMQSALSSSSLQPMLSSSDPSVVSQPSQGLPSVVAAASVNGNGNGTVQQQQQQQQQTTTTTTQISATSSVQKTNNGINGNIAMQPPQPTNNNVNQQHQHF